jgi:RNA polymerase sigma-70 factor (ECF subfamily)
VLFPSTERASSGNIPSEDRVNIDTPTLQKGAMSPAKEPSRPALEFLAVYEELFPFVWRVARRRGVPESTLDDVCQDVFVIVHQRLGEFEGRSSLKTWVYGILNNVILMRHRTMKRRDPERAEVDPDLLVDGAADPADVASGAQIARIAHAMLAELPDEQRSVFILVELEEMSIPEVAEAEQINVNTAYSRLRAARAAFAAAVGRFRAKEKRRT